jgi:serine/threonine protein kinase
MPGWLGRIRMSALLTQLPQRFGAYVLLSPLGQGGMGAVYLAMSGHREMETLCVVKRLLPALRSDPEHVLRFRHEADLARRLVHSNLVHTHNVGEVDGEVFLAQELVEGHDVSDLIDELVKRQCMLPVGVAVYVVSELARGLSYAHAFEDLNLVHRDINLPNVRLTYAGEVKLLDFGIASSDLHGEALGAQQGAGKLWHLAPEQVRPGAIVDRRADLYALGIVLWELLTQRQVGTVLENGREQRVPETEGEVLVWIAQGRHQPPSLFNPQVPPELDALVAKAIRVNPEERFADADELRRALSQFYPTDFHPEQCLSSLLKDLFAPEKERAERRRLVESGRHLLDRDSGDQLERARSGSLPKAERASSSGGLPTLERAKKSGVQASASASAPKLERAKSASYPTLDSALVAIASPRVRRWVLPVSIGATCGMAVLLWWALTTHSRLADGDKPGPAKVAVEQPRGTHDAIHPANQGANPSANPNHQAQTGSTPSQAAGVPPASVARGGDTAAADDRPALAQPGKRVEGAPEANIVAPVRIDHLSQAREAFNARDWARALSEGKTALASGGGADAHALLGNTYFKMGRFVEAQEAYAKAVALDPRNRLLKDRLDIARVRARETSARPEP